MTQVNHRFRELSECLWFVKLRKFNTDVKVNGSYYRSYIHHQHLNHAYILTYQKKKDTVILGMYRTLADAKKSLIIHFLNIDIMSAHTLYGLLREDVSLWRKINMKKFRGDHSHITINELLDCPEYEPIYRAIIDHLMNYLTMVEIVEGAKAKTFKYYVNIRDVFTIERVEYMDVPCKGKPDYLLERLNRII